MLRYLVLFFAVLIQACLFDPPSEPKNDLVPDLYSGVFNLFPNDHAPNDTVVAKIATGVILSAQPNGQYTLSLKAQNPEEVAPLLRIYTTHRYNSREFRIDNFYGEIEAKIQGESWVYEFSASIDEQMDLAICLRSNDSYYPGILWDAKLEGYGAYGNDLNFNLIFTGNVPGFKNDADRDSLKQEVIRTLSNQYSATGVEIGEVRTLLAHENSIWGNQINASEPYIYDYGDKSLDFMSEWGNPEIEKALDVVVVYRFEGDGFLGVSPIYGYNLSKGIKSTIVLASRFKQDGVTMEIDKKTMANTLAHEMGHFFGLRHTSSTLLDLQSEGDFSNIEDGLEDTPFCEQMISESSSFLAKIWKAQPRDHAIRIWGSFATDCPDETNLMFPSTVEGIYQNEISKSQGKIFLDNLSLYPH